MAGGGRLAGVDVADDDDVDMGLFLSHPEGFKTLYDLTLLKECEVDVQIPFHFKRKLHQFRGATKQASSDERRRFKSSSSTAR